MVKLSIFTKELSGAPGNFTAGIKKGFAVLLARCFIFTAVIGINNVYADDAEDYLKELEVEAVKSATVSKEPQSGKSKKSGKGKDNSINTGKIEQFEQQLLLLGRPSTYRFFSKLTMDERQSIVEDYSKHKKLSRASRKIFDLYFSRK